MKLKLVDGKVLYCIFKDVKTFLDAYLSLFAGYPIPDDRRYGPAYRHTDCSHPGKRNFSSLLVLIQSLFPTLKGQSSEIFISFFDIYG